MKIKGFYFNFLKKRVKKIFIIKKANDFFNIQKLSYLKNFSEIFFGYCIASNNEMNCRFEFMKHPLTAFIHLSNDVQVVRNGGVITI